MTLTIPIPESVSGYKGHVLDAIVIDGLPDNAILRVAFRMREKATRKPLTKRKTAKPKRR